MHPDRVVVHIQRGQEERLCVPKHHHHHHHEHVEEKIEMVGQGGTCAMYSHRADTVVFESMPNHQLPGKLCVVHTTNLGLVMGTLAWYVAADAVVHPNVRGPRQCRGKLAAK